MIKAIFGRNKKRVKVIPNLITSRCNYQNVDILSGITYGMKYTFSILKIMCLTYRKNKTLSYFLV